MNKHDNYDTIEVIEKGIDEVEVVEVEKFNPFHDARGRFSNKNGFSSYSANPNTKAGAMAIARSAAAGHGNTANIHRESYGENIRQNANWLGRGKGPNSRWHGNTTLRNRVEPITGLAGASAVGSSWQFQNQRQGRTTSAGKNPPKQGTANQQAQKPAAAKPTKPQANNQKPQQKPANDRQPVDGKDISKTFKYDPRAKGTALDQVAEQQGFKGKPQVIKDSAEFSAAVKDSGIMAYRTINGGRDTVTGKIKTGDQFADDLKNSDAFAHNGNGARVYGSGIYIAANSNPVKGRAPSRTATDAAKADSKMYGGSGAKTVAMTLHPSAKIADYSTILSEFNRIPASTRTARYGNDRKDGLAAYAASKGYDAIRTNVWNCDYIVVYNRSKLICFDG